MKTMEELEIDELERTPVTCAHCGKDVPLNEATEIDKFWWLCPECKIHRGYK